MARSDSRNLRAILAGLGTEAALVPNRLRALAAEAFANELLEPRDILGGKLAIGLSERAQDRLDEAIRPPRVRPPLLVRLIQPRIDDPLPTVPKLIGIGDRLSEALQPRLELQSEVFVRELALG